MSTVQYRGYDAYVTSNLHRTPTNPVRAVHHSVALQGIIPLAADGALQQSARFETLQDLVQRQVYGEQLPWGLVAVHLP
jgi:hypothetical protein